MEGESSHHVSAYRHMWALEQAKEQPAQLVDRGGAQVSEAVSIVDHTACVMMDHTHT